MAGFGGSVKLAGESEYRKALKSITDNLTVLSSEMKVVTSQYDRNDSSTEKLAKQNDILTKKLDEQNKKLAEAKRMLDQSKNSTEANEQTVKKWQNEVNKAQSEVNQTTKALKDNTQTIKQNENAVDGLNNELEDMSKNENNAGQGAIKLGDLIKANIISDVIVGGIKAVGSAMVDLSKKAFELGVQSIKSFAEYEQLVGGVDTLFKESSKTVQDYANNAYKTAGLSANEYMTTVTSFSASLLQSLNGDTEQSAKVADMAITDMSDNANKMGTSMESIQNAYQGFAKQNYTMLDNLKLGYGGTKGEMERLLADATAISGVEYDISQLSDVYEAIHIVQTEIGITGTTSKEASETISGSVSAMKSAWGNLVTGLADENANFSELIGNFVDSILTVGDNILPRIQTVVAGIGSLVSGLLETLVPEILNALPPLIESVLPNLLTAVQSVLASIIAILPEFVQTITAMLPEFINSIISMLPALVDAGVQIILSLVQGLTASIPTLIPTIVDAVITIATNLLNNADMIVQAGIELIVSLGQGLINAIPKLLERLPEIISSLINAITKALPKFLFAGVTILLELGKGIMQAIPKLIAQLPKVIINIASGLLSGLPEMVKIGGQLLAGLFKGLLDPRAIWNAVQDLFNGIVGGIKSIFGIHSPSTVMAEQSAVMADQVGKNLALGLGVGFENTMSSLTDEMTNSVPTNFDVNETTTTTKVGAETNSDMFAGMVDAFKQALKEVNIVLDDEVAGKFVTDTVEKVVYN